MASPVTTTNTSNEYALACKNKLLSTARQRDIIGRIMYIITCPLHGPITLPFVCVNYLCESGCDFQARLPEEDAALSCAHIRTCNIWGVCFPCCCTDAFPQDETRPHYFLYGPERQRLDDAEKRINPSLRTSTSLSTALAKERDKEEERRRPITPIDESNLNPEWVARNPPPGPQ